ncbi:GDSL-type esterase/lipase family protein [Marinimicrobium agarilyticum]|uniref:GDSL-type esterase/lipase family protein n=1 Tax=Marinimicrobium agarilyticum TaxID=306546 RepID=UPI000685D74A|nr:GDSL-type esterase/lipase family protein [Marinimicrobium agarilyticum]
MTAYIDVRFRFFQNWKSAISFVLFSTLLTVSSHSYAQNLVSNPGFENGTSGWTLDDDAAAQYTEPSGRSGDRLTHWSSSASYTANTNQTISGLANGTYRLSAYTVGGATSGAWLWAYCDGSSYSSTIPAAGWGNWTEVAVEGIEVSGGSCQIGITTEDSEWTSIDDVVFERVSGGEPTTVVIEEADGLCGVDGSIDTNHSGFNGSGFANTDNATGNGVNWTVNVPSSGNYTLEWRYANGGSANRPGDVRVNGSSQAIEGFPSTGSWTNWTSASAEIVLRAGENSIRLEGTSGAGLGNIDSLSVTGDSPQALSCGDSSGDCGEGDSGSSFSCNGDPAVCLLGGGVGDYRVAMEFDAGYNGELEVFAESRRRMYASPQQSTSDARCVEFMVNVRDPEGEPYQSDHGTEGLNLRIREGSNALTSLTFTPVNNPRTLFIAGDSTVSDQSPQLFASPASRYSGWGQFIPAYFNDDISVSNYADSGEGTQAFRTDGGSLWNRINARLKAGDWVMIQLGHNDKTTSASLYRSRITNMVTAILDRGATPVLITPMIRNTGDPLSNQHIWGNLNIRNELIGIANAHNVPLIDLMKLTSEWVERIGRSSAQAYFVDNDKTHSNEMGAELFAQMIVDEIRRNNIGAINYLR